MSECEVGWEVRKEGETRVYRKTLVGQKLYRNFEKQIKARDDERMLSNICRGFCWDLRLAGPFLMHHKVQDGDKVCKIQQ